MRIEKLEAWIVFFGSLALFLYGLFNRELVGFETRFVVFTHEVFQYGPHFFPTSYGKPYPDYPAGLPLLNALASLLFGKFCVTVAILPSAIASALSLVLTYQLLAPFQRQWARIAVLLMLFTYEFFDSARSLAMDPFILLASMWAFFIVARNTQIRFVWLALPMIFGFCIRGPIGLIMPAAAIVAYFAGHQHWSSIRRFMGQAIALLMVLLALLFLAAFLEGGKSFVKAVLIMQIFGRIDDHRTHDFFAYFTQSFVNYAVSFELALACILSCWRKFREDTPQARLLKSCCYWIAFILIGMSIPQVRKIRYILPMTPALAILGAYLWVCIPTQISVKKIIHTFYGICFSLPFLGLILTLAVAIVVNIKGYNVSAHFFSSYCTLGLLSIFCLWIFFHKPFYYASRNPKRIIGIGLASMIAILVFIVKPIEVSLNRIQPFVRQVLALNSTNAPLFFFRLGEDAEPIQLLSGLPLKNPPALLFVEDIQKNNVAHNLYLTKASTFDELPETTRQQMKVLLRDKLGHREMVVFTLA